MISVQPHPRATSALILSVLLSLGAGRDTPLAGQATRAVTLAPVSSLLPAPYADPARSLNLLETLRGLHPERMAFHLAAAREATALGILLPEKEDRVHRLERGVAAARAAVALDSLNADAVYWLAASLGLLADQEGGRTKISLAREAHRAALRALELDPDHGGAHHVMGRLHAGAKRLSWVSRLVARGLGLGEIIGEASWESAVEHMRAAAREAPGPLAHHYELGRLLVDTGEVEEGRAVLRELSGRKPRHALDAHYVELARRWLEEAEGGG